MEKKKQKPLYKYLPACAAASAVIAATVTYLVGAVHSTLPLEFDLAVQQFFIDIRTGWLDTVMIFLTHLADTKTIVVFCIILVIMPFRKKIGIPVTLAAIAGVLIYKPMKHIFLRARPDVMWHLVEQGGYSFPSGHSCTSVVFYGLLCYLIGRHCKNPVLRICLQALCGFLAFIIGPTRLYVGVHWATDVLAGWCVGLMVLLLAIYILERIYRKNESI